MWDRALSPVEYHPEIITQNLQKQSGKLNWNGIKFPMEVDKIRKFAKMFLSMSMFFYFDRSVQTLRINNDNEKEHSIDLLLIEEDRKKHYCLFKN